MAEYIFDKFTDGTDTYKIDYSRIPYGTINSGSTSTVFNATVEGITELSNGVCAVIKNGIVTSASGCTLNVNNLGAKPIYSSMADATKITTTFNKNYTALFIYNTIRVSTGCWDMYYGYYTNSTYSNASLGQGYGTCSTAEATTTKAVTLSNYALTTGGVVVVSFTNAVPASSSLNVNSKGSKPIYYRGSAITDGIIEAGDRATFIYSGSYYHLLTVDRSAKVASTSTDGLMSATDKTKLDGITSGAQPNQNAFSTVKVGSTNVQANSTTETLELEAGTNISLTPDTTNKKITIASTVVNTDSKVSTANVVNNTTYYPVVGSNTTNAESKYYDSNGFKYTGTQGTASAVGSAKLELGNSTSSGTANNKEGQLVLYGSGANATTIKAGNPTSARTITLPNKSGTVALTDDIHNVTKQDYIPYETIFSGTEYTDVPTVGAVGEFVGVVANYLTPQMCGASVNGEDDDTFAIQQALDNSLNVYLPAGTYLVSAPLIMRNHTHLWGCGQNSTIKVSDDFSFENMSVADPYVDTFINSQRGKNLISGNGFVLTEIDGIQSYTDMYDSENDYVPPKMSNINIEHLKIDCSSKPYIGGIRLVRPYNDCVIRDVLVVNTTYFGIYVGDETAKADSNVSSMSDAEFTKATRSQTLVVDNCYIGASATALPTRALCYFYNSFELNLKDTKILHSSSQLGNQPCLTLKMGTDAYIRGCSFAHTLGEAIRITDYSRYFRLIGNTYENIGNKSDAIVGVYIRSGATALSSNWLSTTSGGNALTPDTSHVYMIKETSGNYTAGSYYYWTGSAYAAYTNTIRDYAIALLGNSTEVHSQGLGHVSDGLIIETVYSNVPQKIKVDYADNNKILNGFEGLLSTNSLNNTLLNTQNHPFSVKTDNDIGLTLNSTGHLVLGMNSSGTGGGRIALKDGNGVSHFIYADTADDYLHLSNPTAGTNRTLVDKTYVDNACSTLIYNNIRNVFYQIQTNANGNVSPWGAVGYISLSSELGNNEMPIGLYTECPANSNPTYACICGNNLVAYSRTATNVTVQVTWAPNAFHQTVIN